MVGIKPQQSLKRSLFTTDIGIQTEVPVGDIAGLSQVKANRAVSRNGKKLDLDASDLGSILKWSTDIASDINLFFGMSLLHELFRLIQSILALRRLTEIATGIISWQLHSSSRLTVFLTRNLWVAKCLWYGIPTWVLSFVTDLIPQSRLHWMVASTP